jgi:hypothetical protein
MPKELQHVPFSDLEEREVFEFEGQPGEQFVVLDGKVVLCEPGPAMGKWIVLSGITIPIPDPGAKVTIVGSFHIPG